MKNNPSKNYYSHTYFEGETDPANLEWVKIVSSKLLEIPFSSKKKVLDVACGISTLGKTFSEQIYGFDISKEAVHGARKIGINAKIGDVEKRWDYPDECFDIVIASHIIEHLVNPDHLILETKRVLKKDGLLIIATPNLAAWFNRVLLFAGFQPFFSEVSTIDKTLGLKFTRKLTPNRSPLGHLRMFTLGSLKDILKLYEFKIIKVFGVELLAFPPVLLFIDKLFSHFVTLSSNIIIVGRKS